MNAMKTPQHFTPPPPPPASDRLAAGPAAQRAFGALLRCSRLALFGAALFLIAPAAWAQQIIVHANYLRVTVDESAERVQIGVYPFSARTTDITVTYVIERNSVRVTPAGADPARDATLTGAGADISDTNSGTFTIPLATTATFAEPYFFSINITDDTTPEPREDFQVRLTGASGGSASVGSQNVSRITIAASDQHARTFSVSVDDADTTEGDTAVFTVALAGTAPSPAATVDWAISGVDAGDWSTTDSRTLSFSAIGSQTVRVAIAADLEAEGAETLTFTLSNPAGGGTGGTGLGSPAMVTVTIAASTVARRLTLSGPATVAEGRMATYAIALAGTAFATPTDVMWRVDLANSDADAADFTGATSGMVSFGATDRRQTFSIAIADDDATASGEGAESFTVAISTTAGVTVNAISGSPATTTIGGDDDPVAREMRLEAPAATVARGVGQLAAGAVVGRMTAAVASGNTLTLAGRNMAGDGMETLAAQYLAGGRELSVEEMLRQSGFSFTGGDGGRGFNFWGGGSYVSADGDHDGVTYDGDTTAFHVGVDTNWRDGLIGIAIGTSDGDTDFTVTADGMKSTLETDVTSVHPYLTRKFGGSQLWLTAGHGNGDAELKEPGTVIKTDITVTTAAFGITHARGDVFTGGLSALYSRAKLDAAMGDGKSLPATTADGLRITADAEVGKRIGNLRPFALFAFRHDSGDGDTGGALDLGGGVEWRSPTVFVRLEGSGHIQGQGADESRVNFTARKSSGNFNLGLNLAADETGLDTARLLYGEWRF